MFVRKFKFMESQLTGQKARILKKIPDIDNAIHSVEFLQKKHVSFDRDRLFYVRNFRNGVVLNFRLS